MGGVFIDIEATDAVRGDAALAAKLEEVCPVSIFKGTDAGLEIVDAQLDECVLCELCLEAAPAGGLTIHKLYDDSSLTR